MSVHPGTRAPIDETAVIGKARAGDRDAQDVLVRTYLADVYRLAYRLLGDEDLAQDAAQDAMVNAMRALDRFRGDASFRTWVLRIAANSAKSLARRRWRKREVALTAVEGMAGDVQDPAESAVVKDEAARANTMLERLPTKQRLAVDLRINQGLDYQDVARVLKCSTGAARVNYHLGIKRLRSDAMKAMTCDQVRDRLPERQDGHLDDVTAAMLDGHVEGCEDCRAEAELLEQLRVPMPVPADLEPRVLRAVREQVGTVRSLRFPTPRHFAMAATVAFALVTASLLGRNGNGADPTELAWTDAPEGAGMVWTAYEEPLLTSGAGLHALSVEELELVLRELER